MAEVVIAKSESDPALQNYRKLLKGKKLDSAFVSYIFSSKDLSDANRFTRYFLPDAELYDGIITKHTPPKELNWARAALASTNAYKSIRSRAKEGAELHVAMVKSKAPPKAPIVPKAPHVSKSASNSNQPVRSGRGKARK